MSLYEESCDDVFDSAIAGWFRVGRPYRVGSLSSNGPIQYDGDAVGIRIVAVRRSRMVVFRLRRRWVVVIESVVLSS